MVDEAARAAVILIRDRYTKQIDELRRDSGEHGAKAILETLVTVQIARAMLEDRPDAESRPIQQLIGLTRALEHVTDAVMALVETGVDSGAVEGLASVSSILFRELALRAGVTVEAVGDPEVPEPGPVH